MVCPVEIGMRNLTTLSLKFDFLYLKTLLVLHEIFRFKYVLFYLILSCFTQNLTTFNVPLSTGLTVFSFLGEKPKIQ